MPRDLGPARPEAVIAALSFAGVSASFVQTILLALQADLPEILDASREDTAWVITITVLTWTISTPISGRLGDMYGKRRVTLVLLGLLVLGSVVAAVSTSVVPLIVGRGLQGTGIGVIPLGISIARDVLPAKRLGMGIALISATVGIGSALGLPVGAFIYERLDWRTVLWFTAVIGALALALVLRVVPPSTLRSGGRVDWLGVVGLAVGLSCILLAISRGGEWGWASTAVLALMLGGIGVLVLWGWFELRVRDPIVDLRVSARPSVLLTNLATIAMGFGIFAAQVSFPQVLELPTAVGGMGLPLLSAGLVLLPLGFAMLLMAPVTGALQRLRGPKMPFVLGSAIMAIGYLVALVAPLSPGLVLVINILFGLGLGLGYAAIPAIIMRAVPASETGAANGVNTLMRALGQVVAAAAIATVLAQSAVAVEGERLPSTDGFRTSFALGLAATVVCTILALCIPRSRPPAGEHEALPDGVM